MKLDHLLGDYLGSERFDEIISKGHLLRRMTHYGEKSNIRDIHYCNCSIQWQSGKGRKVDFFENLFFIKSLLKS